MAEADSTASIYAVFAYPLTRPGDRELLGAYTSLARASAFVAAQDTDVQANLRVEELKLDVHPSDEFWKKPEGVARADPDGERDLDTRPAELLQDGDLLPDDAIAAIEAARNDERNVAALRHRIAELEARLGDAEDVIRKIANDPLELSSHKHEWQITDHRRWCEAYFEQARRGLPEGTDDIQDLRDELDHQRRRVARFERENAMLQGVVAPVIADLVDIAERIVRESSTPEGSGEFNASSWVEEWVRTPHPALGGQCPLQLLGTAEGRDGVRSLLERQQSGAYS